MDCRMASLLALCILGLNAMFLALLCTGFVSVRIHSNHPILDALTSLKKKTVPHLAARIVAGKDSPEDRLEMPGEPSRSFESLGEASTWQTEGALRANKEKEEEEEEAEGEDSKQLAAREEETEGGDASSCEGKKVYIYKGIPAAFDRPVSDCLRFCPQYEDVLCSNLPRDGLGPRFKGAVVDKYGSSEYKFGPWLATEQHMLGLLFRKRMESYKCRTTRWEEADAFYVPALYGLVEVCHRGFPFLERLTDQLQSFLSRQPGFKRKEGADHFIVEGQQIWSFMNYRNRSRFGAYILRRPFLKNIHFVSIEGVQWERRFSSIPYPTSFHPASMKELEEWRGHVRGHPRKHLISIAAGARGEISVRGAVIQACKGRSDVCTLVDCQKDCPANFCFGSNGFCSDPRRLFSLLLSSTFCLQPPGDSATRRATLDSLLAGCIPVFFANNSFRDQYNFNLPGDKDEISITFDGGKVLDGSVDFIAELEKVPEAGIQQKRERILSLMSRIVFRDHTKGAQAPGGFKDALDYAIDGLVEVASLSKPSPYFFLDE